MLFPFGHLLPHPHPAQKSPVAHWVPDSVLHVLRSHPSPSLQELFEARHLWDARPPDTPWHGSRDSGALEQVGGDDA